MRSSNSPRPASAEKREKRIGPAVEHPFILRSGFQHVANSLPQAIGAERVLQHDDYRRTSARSDFGVDGARHVNNFEVWIIQFEKFRQIPTRSVRESHFGQQQVYPRYVPCGGPDRFLAT